MRALAITLSLLLVACLLISCNVERVNPSVHGPYTSSVAARLHAETYAKTVGGDVYYMSCCDSMAPLIRDGDYVVVVPRDLTDALLGHVVMYRPVWREGRPTIHRLVGSYSDGYIAEGDARVDNQGNPIVPETREPVTGATWGGEVVAVYQVRL